MRDQCVARSSNEGAVLKQIETAEAQYCALVLRTQWLAWPESQSAENSSRRKDVAAAADTSVQAVRRLLWL